MINIVQKNLNYWHKRHLIKFILTCSMLQNNYWHHSSPITGIIIFFMCFFFTASFSFFLTVGLFGNTYSKIKGECWRQILKKIHFAYISTKENCFFYQTEISIICYCYMHIHNINCWIFIKIISFISQN